MGLKNVRLMKLCIIENNVVQIEKQHQPEDIQELLHKLLMPVCNDFMTFFNPLFDSDDDFSSSDDESFSNEDVPKEKSLLNRDISTVSYPKIDYLLEEFSGELTHINLIPPGINKADFDPEEEIRLIDHTEETSSGGTTTHSDNSLHKYDSFLFEIEPDQGELTSVVMEDILGEPRVHVPNVLPTYPTLMLDSNFIPSDDSLGSDLEVSFPSGTRNKIFDLGIFFEVQSKRFLSRIHFLSHLSVILFVQ
ncbi:hypothetical protein Tco_0645433 [Tanacetum coccineum]